MSDWTETELEWRRAKYAQILRAQAADAERMAEIAGIEAEREVRRNEALAIIDTLVGGGSAAEFRAAIDKWSRLPGFSGFNSPNGQMFLNQLVASTDDDTVAAVLRSVLVAPADAVAAADQLRTAIAFVESVRKGAYPAPARVPFLCSFFWALQDRETWPVAWPSAFRTVQQLAWMEGTAEPVGDHLAYREVMRSLHRPAGEAEYAFHWFDRHPFVGLDPTILHRCQRGVDIRLEMADDRYADDALRDEARQHARSVLSELRLLGRHIQDRVAEALGRSVKAVVPGLDWKDGVFRADGWVAWRGGAGGGAALRLWVTAEGVAIGVHCGHYRGGWYREVPQLIDGVAPSNSKVMLIAGDHRRLHPEEDGRGAECFIGWWWPGEELVDDAGLADRVVRAATDLQPVLDALLIAGDGGDSSPVPEPDVKTDLSDLEALKERFVAERGYPIDKDIQARAEREKMAVSLAPDELPIIDLSELRSIINTKRYGNPGPQSILNTTLRDASPAELETLLNNLVYLCWGDDPVEKRIDRILDLDDLGARGLGESVVMKLLAITDPERFLPVFPYTGDMGKARMLKLLGMALPDPALSRGERHLRANDDLRRVLDPLFPGDPWGQAQFLYWLNASDVTGGDEADTDPADELAELADRLLMPKEFLDDIVGLLEDKRQVIFYGPPGTGKTYLARELAKVLAPDPNRRMLVQFHPSTSYEDFFEGYRPEDTEGELRYRLTKGPLALLAERAEQAPGQRHVMIIDEINRANLPKVFGELLFLLEYRGESVRSLYRPDDTFELPEDLLFIGTMNTADRSIALIDAAMRRRFHFVPFFPNDGPIQGLLERWLEREGEPAWIAELVDKMNAELVDELGGPHLQIGPSHFMKHKLNEDQLRRIWTYNIYPFIEDQLFGEPERIQRYRFDTVLARFHKEVAGDDTDLASVDEAAPAE